MPTLQKVVTEFARRDVVDRAYSIDWTVRELLRVGTPDADQAITTLVAAMPMNPTRLDLLTSLAERDARFAAPAIEALAWHNQRAALAQTHLAQFMKPYGSARNIIDYPGGRSDNPDAARSRPIAEAIVRLIPENSDTSPIETSVAYVNGVRFVGSTYGDILGMFGSLWTTRILSLLILSLALPPHSKTAKIITPMAM